MLLAIIRGIVALLVLLGVIYVADYLSVQYHFPSGRPQFGQVTVYPFYVIHVKGGKIQYEPGQPEPDTCVHSVFPHYGYTPCWYMTRHTDKHINI